MPNVNPKELKNIRCAECNSPFWLPAFLKKRVPALLVGAPQDSIMELNTWRCADCGEPIPGAKEFIDNPPVPPGLYAKG